MKSMKYMKRRFSEQDSLINFIKRLAGGFGGFIL